MPTVAEGSEEEQTKARRMIDAVRFPPPIDEPLFPKRSLAAAYLGGWGLTLVHVTLWILIAVGVLHSTAITIGNSVVSFVATCLLVGMVVAVHRRLQMARGTTTRHIMSAWWRGPWDPVGRLVWLPVRIPSAVSALGGKREPSGGPASDAL